MEFPPDPISFLDLVNDEHKRRLVKRKKVGESLRYMGEVIDQLGRGEEFMRIYVHNAHPSHPDPTDPETDLALLQLYDHWRARHSLRPIEPWDGTRLRPWLPPESNPAVPAVLTGDLTHFLRATLHTPIEGLAWRRLDALGHAVEAYFTSIRRHSVWSRPSPRPHRERQGGGHAGMHAGHQHGHQGDHGTPPDAGGELRLYHLNELNNIEAAVYSIRFWGFLKWADDLRRLLFGLPIDHYHHDELSDISFLDKFVLNHFPWHDDVFAGGVCPSWEDQFGRQAFHRYALGTQGYGIEFLQFHRDLLASYDQWRRAVGMPAAQSWHPGKHHTAYVLKYSDGGWWGRGGTNGRPLNPEVVVPEFNDEDLAAFSTAAELGNYLDACGVVYHGVGHTQSCDIRDQYCNTYSVRFYGWHKWIDGFFERLRELGKPLFDATKPLDNPLSCAKFQQVPQPKPVLNGIWTFRSFRLEPDAAKNPAWLVGELRLSHAEDGKIGGELVLQKPETHYEVRGYVDENNVYYETTPPWWDDRAILVMKVVGTKHPVEGHVYELRGTFQAHWPHGNGQIPAFTGSLVCSHQPDDSEKEGQVGSFFAVKKGEPPRAEPKQEPKDTHGKHTQVFFESGTFVVPPGVTKVSVKVWGGGGGGGSDGPGVGGDNGKIGGTSRFGKVCVAAGGHGGKHGVYQLGEGGAGGTGITGEVLEEGGKGEKGGTEDGLTGKGGIGAGGGGKGGYRVGKLSNGRPGAEPGGGGSGAQEGMSPGGGGGGGGYAAGTFTVVPGSSIEAVVGQGGHGGDGGYRIGGDGADGRVEVGWEHG